MSKLSICFAGLSRQEEAEVVSLFKQANAQAGNHWVVAPENDAGVLVIDMDSMYGQMSLMKALGTANPAESKDVTITGPDIAENGAVVPVGAATTLPGVKRLLLLVEKNPSMLAAMFDVTDAVEPNISTRVKMGQSSNVFAVAITADNKVLYAAKEIKVTLGGCGG